MVTDYDAPCKNEDEIAEGSIEELESHRSDVDSTEIEEDEDEAAENLELPGADLSKEELTAHTILRQEDESVYLQCSLVHHTSQFDYVGANGIPVCTECAM